MENVSATDAAHRFSELLDAVEWRGATFLIARRGRTVARLGPAAVANGSELKLLLRGARPDPDWPNDLDELRASLTVEERSWNG